MTPTPLFDGDEVRLKQCRHGLMSYFKHDQYVGRSFDVYGEFSESETSLFKEAVQPGDIVVEVGANIGSHTLFLAQSVGSQGAVLAFEPQRRVFQMLCGNLALNGIENVRALQMGLGDGDGVAKIPALSFAQTVNVGGVSLASTEAAPDWEDVEVRTLDSFNLPRLDFLKIDVEGMEEQVLRGAEQTIRRCRPLLYVENDREDKSESLLRYMLSLGYRLWWHLPIMYNEDNFFGNKENIFPGIVSINVFGVPEELEVQVNRFSPVEDPAIAWSQGKFKITGVY